MELDDILSVIRDKAAKASTGKANAKKFTKAFKQFIDLTKDQFEQYLQGAPEDEVEDDVRYLVAHDVLQKPSKLAPAYFAWVSLGALFDALDECNDQTPVNPQLVRALFDDKDTGLFTLRRFYNDVEVLVDESNTHDGDPINLHDIAIGGGRHRLTALQLILKELGYKLDSEQVRAMSWRCSIKTVERLSEVPLLQKLANTTRSMGTTENARVRIATKDTDVDDIYSILKYAYENPAASAKTEAYTAIFAYAMPPADGLNLNTETLGHIGRSFYAALKKVKFAEPDSKNLVSFSLAPRYQFEHIDNFHSAIIAQAWELMPEVVAERRKEGFNNIARDAAKVASILVEKTIEAVGLTTK